jgi:hypothetical protein
MRAALSGGSLALVAAFVAAMLFGIAASRAPTLWGTDSFVYAVRMQLFAGVPAGDAVATTRTFLRTLPDPQDSPANGGPLDKQLGWRLFSVRPVYSLLAAPVWDWRGFAALPDVSIVSYTCAIVALFWLASSIVPEVLAFFVAVAFGALAFGWANAGLTDMTAMFFLVVALGALCRYLSSGRPLLLVIYALATGLLTFTRPIPYIILAAAVASLINGLLRRDAVLTRTAVRLVFVAAVWCAALTVAAATLRVPSLWAMVRHLHDYWTGTAVHSPRELISWWIGATLVIARDWLLHDAAFVWPLLGIAGLVVRSRDARFCALFGAWCAGFLSIALNPDAYAAARTVVLPSLPVVLCGIAGLITVSLERWRTRGSSICISLH